MDVTAEITFQDGRTAEITGPNKEAVEAEIQRLEAQFVEAQQPQANVPKTGSALNLLGQGLTFGFGDELAAAASTVRAPFSDKSAGELYNEQLGIERQNIAQSKAAYPKISMAAEVFGGLMTGGFLGKQLAARATPMLNKLPAAAKLAGAGAAGGATYAAGTAEDNRLAEAGKGALVGAVAVPVAGVATSVAGNILKKLGAPLVRALQNTPRNQAERLIKNALEAGDIDEAFVRQELARLGPEATLADVADPLSRLARGVAAKSGKGSSIARSFLDTRQAGQQASLTGKLDVKNFRRTFEKFVTDRSTQATPLYEEAYATPLKMTSTMQTLLKRPSIASALKKASAIIAEEGGGSGHVRMADAIKQDLDDRIGVALRAGNRQDARRLIRTRAEWLKEVDAQVPAYAKAREIFANEASMRDAANMGRSLFTGKKNLDAIEVAIEAMSESERTALRMGALRGLVDQLESTANNRNAAGKLIASPRARETLRRVFPDEDSYAEFLGRAEAASRFSQTRNTVLGGSPTSRIDADKADLEAAAGVGSAMLNGADPISMTMGLLRSIGVSEVSQETLEETAKLLFARELPERTIQRVTGRAAATPSIVKQARTAGVTNAILQGESTQ